MRERELLKRFEHELHGKLIEERGKFTEEIAAWVARLRGIEKAVEGIVFITFSYRIHYMVCFAIKKGKIQTYLLSYNN